MWVSKIFLSLLSAVVLTSFALLPVWAQQADPRHEDYLQPWIACAQALAEFTSTHARHDHIREDDINRDIITADLERRGSVARRQHRVA